MTFDDYSNQSVSNGRILVDLDIGFQNSQWLNYGAGIWYVNSNNIYEFADLGLLDSFTAQNFATIGSVSVDGSPLTEVTTLSALGSTEEAFFYDINTESCFVRLLNSENPEFHTVVFGAIFGYSFTPFIPIGSNVFYEGRLIETPQISKSRDPLFFGRIKYQGGDVPLANADGYFDNFGESNDIYGNEARVKYGFDELPITEYKRIFTGYIETFAFTETTATFSIVDKRKQLSKPITYSCTNKNALDAIVEIIQTSYPHITYSGSYYDVMQWDAMQINAPLITINMQKPDSTINIIQEICATVFGIFFVTPENLFSFKVVNITEDLSAEIPAENVMNKHSVSYDPSQVISSVRVGYNRDWTTASNAYTYITDTGEEAGVFLKYKTYNQKDFNTLLPDSGQAADFASKVLDYTKDVHATFSITTSLQYYYLEIGQMISVDVTRFDQTIFGISICEVTGITYNLSGLTMIIRLRKLTQAEQSYEYRITEDGEMRETENAFLRIMETG